MGGTDLLVSSWCDKVKTSPENYILLQEIRPKTFSISKDIPVIDLQQAASSQGPSDLLDQTSKIPVIGTYTGEVRKLSVRIMDLISAGLGLEKGYFAKELSKEQGFLINYYPPCPEPNLALGTGLHCGAYLIALIQQDAYGLQSTDKNGQWVGVESIPNAFIVIVANQLEIISNRKLRSCVHRGVTNSEVDRVSIVSFTSPDTAKVIGPATELLSAENPPRYKSYKYLDFLMHYMDSIGKRDLSLATTLGPYQLQP